MRVGRRRVEIADLVLHRQRQAQPARRVDPPAVAIHRELHDRIVEAAPLVVEQQHGVLEGVPHRVVQRLVGIGRRRCPASIRPGGEVFAGLAMAAHANRLVRRLVPRVAGRAAVRPGLDILVVVGEHGKRRDDVFLEILVLVVAPHDDQSGLKSSSARRASAKCGRYTSRPRAAAEAPQSLPSSSRSGAGQLPGSSSPPASPGRRARPSS